MQIYLEYPEFDELNYWKKPAAVSSVQIRAFKFRRERMTYAKDIRMYIENVMQVIN